MAFLKHPGRFSVALKVAIVLLAAGYVVHRFLFTEDKHSVAEHLAAAVSSNPYTFLIVLLLMPVNWLLEAWKWKLAAGRHVQIGIGRALKGVLAGVTIGTATPNRVGEFAGRIFMEKEGDRVQLLLLSFVCSFCQVAVTIIAGMAGLSMMEGKAGLSDLQLVFIVSAGILFFCLPLLLKFIPEKWNARTQALREFPAGLFSLVMVLSAIRYSVYVTQFILLLEIFRPEGLPVLPLLACVMTAYLVVTMIPTFSFTEVIVRGSIAGLVFEGSGVLGYRVGFAVAVVLWTINVALPSLIGSVYVFRLKFFSPEK
jgi:hypothetical protein